ncbi:MAG: hypothetical protein EZS28_044680 [Streblomastix strix]|uniref:Uncharacterized protein n=1 Tax=Streblomastix strix TaxID=222440 RepID=A0A5J4TPJ2_9EUKA|nr:MAG: hypothetical protein EZS28_044680 [Streblomastix strix]
MGNSRRTTQQDYRARFAFSHLFNKQDHPFISQDLKDSVCPQLVQMLIQLHGNVEITGNEIDIFKKKMMK